MCLAIPNKTQEEVAQFFYELYCRYMAPEECIIHDRGKEFANKVMKKLHASYGVEIRVTAAARPQANGQAEAEVKQLKKRMKALMTEQGMMSLKIVCRNFQT